MLTFTDGLIREYEDEAVEDGRARQGGRDERVLHFVGFPPGDPECPARRLGQVVPDAVSHGEISQARFGLIGLLRVVRDALCRLLCRDELSAPIDL